MPMLEVVVAERDGRIVGCCRPAARGGARPLLARRPRARRRGRARRRAAAATSSGGPRPTSIPGARAMTYVASVDDTVRGVVEAAGYRPIRASYYMAIALDDPPQPVWPEGIEVGDVRPRRGRGGRLRGPAGVVPRPLGAHRPPDRGVALLPRRHARASIRRSGSSRATAARSRASALCRVALVGRSGARLREHARRPAPVAQARPRPRAPAALLRRHEAARDDAREPRRRRREPHRRSRPLRARRHAASSGASTAT